MLTIYKTEEGRLHEVSEVQPGCWINLAAPTAQELQKVSEATGALPELLRAALDEEERSHIEAEEDEKQTLILVDIPRVENCLLYTSRPVPTAERPVPPVAVQLFQLPA